MQHLCLLKRVILHQTGQEKLEKQRELVESMFPGEKVHHNDTFSNCPKDCGNFKHEWLYKKELAFCPETKTWWLAFVEGKGMFCLLCRKHDCQNPQNKSAMFNKTPATRYKPAKIKEHVDTLLSSHSHPGKTSNNNKMQFTGGCCKEPHSFQFTTFYIVAKEEMANIKVLPLLRLLNLFAPLERLSLTKYPKCPNIRLWLLHYDVMMLQILEHLTKC